MKWLLELADGETVETVLIPAPGTADGVHQHPGGVSGPVLVLRERTAWTGARSDCGGDLRSGGLRLPCGGESGVDNVVVMGMGEPLLNLDSLLPALEMICSPEGGLGIGARHITVSTSGIVPGIRRLASAGRQWNLALSLHGVNDERRARLIPATHRYPLADVLQACREYREATGRMVTLEYALIAEKNDGRDDLAALAAIARDLRAKVNLIPCNAVGAAHRASSSERVRSFHDGLLAAGVQATVRRRKGADIEAACGQLRARRDGRNNTETDE